MDDTTGNKRLKKQIRKKKNDPGVLPFLPDEIIANIISRLSVKTVIRCRLVCKNWRDLTLNQDFVHLNFRHSLPLIFVAEFGDVCDLNFVDKWWVSSTSRMIHRIPFEYSYFNRYEQDPLSSQGGLIVFNELHQSVILRFIVNPIYPAENVKITLSAFFLESQIYGVFFHPLLEEYCSLWKMQVSDEPWGHSRRMHYMMLTLGSHPSLKTVSVSDVLLDRVMKPTTHRLLIGNYLYWMLQSRPNNVQGWNDVMKFDITSEEFIVIDCPVPLNTKCRCSQTLILDIDGILSYLLILPRKITIWSLKDHKEHLWTRSEYMLNVEISTSGFQRGIAVVNGKFAFLSGLRLHICNLQEGTVRKCRKRKQSLWYIDLSHQMSLASLSNCKPTISIDQDQDNKVVLVEEDE